MPLDATVSGTAADSYLNLVEANTLAANYGLSVWSGKTDQEKEIALRRAALEIDSHRVHDPAPAKTGQSRLFPRSKDAGLIPEAVKHAAILQADWIATSGESDRKSWEGAKAGPVKDAGNGSPLCPRAFSIFARFIARTAEYS